MPSTGTASVNPVGAWVAALLAERSQQMCMKRLEVTQKIVSQGPELQNTCGTCCSAAVTDALKMSFQRSRNQRNWTARADKEPLWHPKSPKSSHAMVACLTCFRIPHSITFGNINCTAERSWKGNGITNAGNKHHATGHSTSGMKEYLSSDSPPGSR